MPSSPTSAGRSSMSSSVGSSSNTNTPASYTSISMPSSPPSRNRSRSRSRSKTGKMDSRTTYEKSFFEHVIPDPSHPRAIYRTVAFGILVFFVLIVCYLALVEPSSDEAGGLPAAAPGGWVRYKGVVWKEDTDTYEQGVDMGLEVPGGELDKVMGGTVTKENAGKPVEKVSKVVFPESRSREVEVMLENGELSDYSWHEELQSWTSESTGKGRLIIVGDVHGTHLSLKSLLARLSYSATTDHLLHVGDLIAKSPLADSLETLRLMRTYDAKGVRGNHDQGVIEWRRWMEAFGSVDPASIGKIEKKEEPLIGIGSDRYRIPLKSKTEMTLWIDPMLQSLPPLIGRVKSWLPKFGRPSFARSKTTTAVPFEPLNATKIVYSTPTRYSRVKFPPSIMPDHPVDHQSLATDGALLGYGWEWLNSSADDLADMGITLPEGWEWGGDWFEVARHLPKVDMDYLVGLPLTMHLQGFNSYLVHAGMIPGDFTSYSSKVSKTKGPPVHLPELLNSTSLKTFLPSTPDTVLLSTPERSLLLVQQNTDPFTLLNVRALSGKKSRHWTATKGKKGTAWNKVWNEAMLECDKGEACTPVNLIYGHWAGNGLDLRKNSFGLDSGCVYGRKLSAIVIASTDASASPLDTPAKLSLSAFRQLTSKPVIEATISATPSHLKLQKLYAERPIHIVPSPTVTLSAFWSPPHTAVARREFRKRDAYPQEEEEARVEQNRIYEKEEFIASTVSTTSSEHDQDEVGDMLGAEAGIGGAAGVAGAAGEETDEEEPTFESQSISVNGRKSWVVSCQCPVV